MERFFLLQFLFFAVWLAMLVFYPPAAVTPGVRAPGAPNLAPAKVYPASVKTGLNGEWIEDAKIARELATQSGRPILYFFTGSDWCLWCKKLHAETLSKPGFKDWAAKRVVLMKVDLKQRSPQPPALKSQNAKLMEELKTEGKFPMLVFVEPSGREAGRMGYFPGGPELVIPAMEQALAGQIPGGDTPPPAN